MQILEEIKDLICASRSFDLYRVCLPFSAECRRRNEQRILPSFYCLCKVFDELTMQLDCYMPEVC
jgi:hypothetical protein